MSDLASQDFKDVLFKLISDHKFKDEIMNNMTSALTKFSNLTADEKLKIEKLVKTQGNSLVNIASVVLENRQDAGFANID